MQLAQLLLVDRARRLRQQALGPLRLRERDHVTDRLRAGHHRDDAVEAEALAQYLRDPSQIDTIPELTITYVVTDAQALREHLLSSKRVQNVPFDPAQFHEANEPPPLAVFLLFDREVPPTAQNLTRDNVPKVLGEMLL